MAEAQPDDVRPVLFPAYRAYLQARTTVNDNLMALVVAAGLAADRLSELPPDVLLGDAFPHVPHVQRMNQRISEVRPLLDDADVTIAHTAIPYIVAVYGVFLADAIGLLQGTGRDQDPHEPDDTYLSTLHERFEIATERPLPPRELALFDLIRVVRNRLVHQAGTPGSQLATKWRQLDADSKDEWLRLARRPLTDAVLGRNVPIRLGLGELYAVLAVTHRLAHRVNGALVEGVTPEVWADMVVSDYRDGWPRRYGDPAHRLGRLRGYARQRYGPLALSKETLEDAVKRVEGSTN